MAADRYGPEHRRARGNGYMIAKGRVALTNILAGTAEGRALIDGHVVSDHGGFADDYANAVVNEQTLADGCRRVDINARAEAARFGNHPAQQLHAARIEKVRPAVHPYRAETRVAKHDLQRGERSRVAVKHRLNIAF
ncbi:hypothetical protein SDC9_78109 [bioreactor metagenome]|uniref:Uncharacterized protein n=1 Tax=bioreactor metagenome TaxID=1076179 RepID=A0A644Z027_9ZZZZ